VLNTKGEALPFVNITVNKGLTGTATDLNGRFMVQTSKSISHLQFSYIGYQTITLSGESLTNPLKVQMEELTETLKPVTVTPGANPAHRIIRNAVANADANNPENLNTFSYKAYSKFWVSFNLDSVDPRLDTVMASELLDSTQSDSLGPDSIAEIDSTNYKMHRFFEEQHLFFMETLTERKFRSALRDNETVLAQRSSGFKNPMFALLVTQLQSFSFYNNYVGISGSEYLNPISKGSTSRYFFILEDTLFNGSKDTTYVISFRPRPNTGFKALTGVLSINSTDWALENVRAQPASVEAIPVIIQQEYKRYGRHTWFPVAFKADIEITNLRINEATPQAVMRRRLLDIEINQPLKRREVPLAQLSVPDEASQNTEALFKAYRSDSLSQMEKQTYTFMDSVSEEANFEQGLNIAVAVSRGYVPWRMLHFDLSRLFNYNQYEGFRLGLGVNTNQNFSKWLQFGGYFAYGFKDQTSKYGLNTRLDIIKNLGFALIGGTQFDLLESGGFTIPGTETPSLLENSYRRLFIEQWDEETRHYTALQIDPLPMLSYELRGQVSQRQTVGDYIFGTPANATATSKTPLYNYTEITNTLRFAPQEEFAQTPFGKITLKGGYPVIWLSYTKGLAGLLNGDFNFDKLQLQAEYRYKTLGLGTTILHLRGGHVFQDLPYSQNFVGTTNGINARNFWRRSEGLADRNSFETMRFNEFLSNTYVELMWRQDFKTLFYRGKKFRPHFELVNRLAFGSLRTPALHQGLEFKTLEQGFFESGIECNRLYITNFIGLGLGFYYRYGANHLPRFEDNLAIKLTSKFAF
jgi:hypothetical protein